jgi:protein-disulfide isomerase
MKRMLATLVLLGGAVSGCTKDAPSLHAAAPANAAPPGLHAEAVLATMDGHAITVADVDKEIAPQLSKLSQKLESDEFELRKQALDELLVRRLVAAEARKEGTTENVWLKRHVDESTPEALEADAKKFYDEHAARMGGRSFDQEKPLIIPFLTKQRRQEAAARIFDDLKAKANVEIMLEEPAVDVAAVGPSMGPASAPVTIVEFSDFECPFCAKVEPTIKQVMSDYAGKVRFVFRDYPLPFHAHAQKASEASHCAEAQDRYWPMHDVMFSNQDKLDIDGLKKLASGVAGMNQAKFDACLDSGEMTDTVTSNERAGEVVGVSGTPHFFVNGRSLDGAQPYEEFKKAIDRELARARKGS